MANSIDCGIWQFGKKAYGRGKISIFKTVINTDENSFDDKLRQTTRNKFGWTDKVVYGFIGRYVPQKNPFFLIDIFNEIAKKQENAILVLIGFGELEHEMHCRIQKHETTRLSRRDFRLPESLSSIGEPSPPYHQTASHSISSQTTTRELRELSYQEQLF